VITATPNANASTSGDGRVLMGRNVETENASESSSRAAPIATTRPAMPPPMASRMLSTSACVTICDREAPIAIRTAVCVRRATERASSRFATFAQAISSTSPHTAINNCRLLAYCSFITPTPAPAGTIAIVCFGSRWSTSDSQFAGQPASRGIHWRRTFVSRGAMPSVVAPGLRRPMTRSQAETGWRSSELAPVTIGSC
jgi:hypothetical protein